MSKRGEWRCERGFTLLEVMIALSILAGVVMTLVVSTNYHMDTARRENELAAALILGLEKTEEFKLTGLPSQREGVFSGAFADYSWKAAVKDTEVPAVKEVGLSVTWGKGAGVTITSFIQTGK